MTDREKKYYDLRDEHIDEIDRIYKEELDKNYKRRDIPTIYPLWNKIISRVLSSEWRKKRDELTEKGKNICKFLGYGEDNYITEEKEKIRKKVTCSSLEKLPLLYTRCSAMIGCEYYKKTMKDLLEKEKLLKEASSYFEEEIKNCDLYR